RITRPEVEQRILRRVAEIVDFIQSTISASVSKKLDPELVLDLYRDLIIPLTKEGELLYIFNRRA
ncbi:MAG TPA: chorismate mutase, partial [Spirochaetia bacterium]|nr:chorismate mutase [Spirochaetia bacterium]